MTAPEERAGCEHAGPGYWGWWCRDCHSISVSQARAKFAQEDMLDKLAILRRRLEAEQLANAEAGKLVDSLSWRIDDLERRLEEARAALADLVHAIDRLPTVQNDQDMSGWWAKTKFHVAKARPLLARLSPPPPRKEA